MSQLNNDGDVIAYRPHLEYNKDVRTKLEDKFFQEGQPVEYTPAVIAFIRTKASDVLLAFDETINNANGYIAAIGSYLSDGVNGHITFQEFVKAIQSGDEDTVSEFLGNHSNNINGDTGVEVYKHLTDAVSELSDMKRIFGKIVYGDYDVSLDTAINMDAAYNNKLTDYENNKDYGKINYAALSIDTLFNKTVGGYVGMMDSFVNGLYSLHNYKPFIEPLNNQESISKTLNTMFKQSLNVNDNDNKKLATYTNRNLIPSIMKEIVVKRKDYLDLLDAKSTLNKVSFSNPDIIDKNIKQIYDSVNNSVVDFNKSIISVSMYRDDILNSLGEKDYFRNIYKSLM